MRRLKGGAISAMAKYEGIKVKLDSLLRPCIVEGRKALFHRMYTRYQIVAPSPMVGGPPGGQISFTLAVVEFEDGSVREVHASMVKFLDTQCQMDEFEACYYKEDNNDGCC